ncbi:MAG: crossover junction endodeoxyribonuclease RuvC [Candidatus Omnitrophica bacterium]|nr:crossover junction endodeoxyribonuclease RuvC [Candidatus Omnitrophota bacterium]
MARIIGIDPGTWRTGVGVIESSGNHYHLLHSEVITITQSVDISKRLLIIFRSLLKVIQDYRPEILALENIFYHKNIRSMIKIGEARACAMLAASEQGIGVVEYLPTRVKQAVTGNGRASKQQIQQMAKKLLGLKEIPPSDAADAMAVAICHLNCKGSSVRVKSQSINTKWKKLVAEGLKRSIR